MAKKSAAEKAAEERARNKSRQQAATQAASNAARGPAKGLPAATSQPAAPAAPAAPPRIDPFFTAADLAALNDFTTDLRTKLQGIDFNLGNLETDTKFQKTGVEKGAKEAAVGATDDAISRGIFSSSIKDAAIYDIEAQRALSVKFLDDKLRAATLDAGTNKKILSDAKERFDEAMLARQKENAQGVNDSNSSAWAAAMAAWQTANPTANTAAGVKGAATVPTFKPSAPQKGQPGAATIAPQPYKPPNVSPTQTGSSTPKPKSRKPVVYG